MKIPAFSPVQRNFYSKNKIINRNIYFSSKKQTASPKANTNPLKVLALAGLLSLNISACAGSQKSSQDVSQYEIVSEYNNDYATSDLGADILKYGSDITQKKVYDLIYGFLEANHLSDSVAIDDLNNYPHETPAVDSLYSYNINNDGSAEGILYLKEIPQPYNSKKMTRYASIMAHELTHAVQRNKAENNYQYDEKIPEDVKDEIDYLVLSNYYNLIVNYQSIPMTDYFDSYQLHNLNPSVANEMIKEYNTYRISSYEIPDLSEKQVEMALVRAYGMDLKTFAQMLSDEITDSIIEVYGLKDTDRALIKKAVIEKFLNTLNMEKEAYQVTADVIKKEYNLKHNLNDMVPIQHKLIAQGFEENLD